ncbi:MAG: phage virion morphogenesis protein [Synergistaceae bacterium]|jgi:phage gpG-like protein|nr:phage virion morphogenesis protein [Synergistaceae bacterium]
MEIDAFAREFNEKMSQVKQFVEGEDIKDILGTEAVNHFKESFKNEGFEDKQVVKWADVERRDPASKWHGHSGQTGKFSTARTQAPILSGETRELRESISYVKIPTGARITNDTPYAAVHQFGLQAKIYGKKAFTMIARPFMGKSVVLKEKIEGKIENEIKNILK